MTQPAAQQTPHYHGHRDRLRARFLENGPEALADYELLELVMFMAIPRRDVKPLAKTLLARFGGLPELMNASIEELVKIPGISESTAAALKANGAKKVVAYCTHPVLSGPAIENITSSQLDTLVVTDTIPLSDAAKACGKIRQVSMAGMLAEAVRRTSNEESLSAMFDRVGPLSGA